MQASRASKNLIYSKIGSSKEKKMIQSYSPKLAVKGKDLGKKGKNFAKIAAAGDKKYGKGHGARIAGAILKKLRA